MNSNLSLFEKKAIVSHFGPQMATAIADKFGPGAAKMVATDLPLAVQTLEEIKVDSDISASAKTVANELDLTPAQTFVYYLVLIVTFGLYQRYVNNLVIAAIGGGNLAAVPARLQFLNAVATAVLRNVNGIALERWINFIFDNIELEADVAISDGTVVSREEGARKAYDALLKDTSRAYGAPSNLDGRIDNFENLANMLNSAFGLGKRKSFTEKPGARVWRGQAERERFNLAATAVLARINAVLAEKDLEDAQRAVNAKINASVISEIDKKNGGIILNEKDNRSIVAKMKASVKDCARDGSYGKRLLDALSTGDVGAILCANSTNTAIDTATIKKISVEFIDSTLIEVIESFSYENGTFTFYNPQFKKLTDATKLDAAYEVILNEISGGITAAAEEIRKSIGLFSALVPKATTTNLAEKQAAELNGLIGAVREIRRDMAREIADEFNNCEVDMSKKEVTKNGTVEIGSAGMPLAKAIVFLAQDETIQKGASREIDSLKKAKKVIGDLNEKLHPSIFPNLS